MNALEYVRRWVWDHLEYDESPTKSWYRPRHPVVCIIGVIGMLRVGWFLWSSQNLLLQLYFWTLLTMYIVSTTHHWVKHDKWLQKLDHIVIFWVIGMSGVPYLGTFVPEGFAFPIGLVIVIGTIQQLLVTLNHRLRGWIFLVVGLVMGGIVFIYLILAGQYIWGVVFLLGGVFYIASGRTFSYCKHNWFPRRLGYREVQHSQLLGAIELHGRTALALVR